MVQIDTGGLSFQKLREYDKYYVDKSLLIKDILSTNDMGVYLFTRPRRFGKTTNLTMLDAFFNIEYKGNTWFDDLAISQFHEFDHFKNAFPVVYIDLKDTKTSTFESFVKRMRAELYKVFFAHRYLLKSDVLTVFEQKRFTEVFEQTVDEDYIRDCIPLLCDVLKRYYDKNVIVLIDEYDSAVSDAFGQESHRPMLDFLAGFLSATLKSNDSLQMAYVTGVMQIAKESIFSSLNNISVNNIFSIDSDERFGFTEAEVKKILSDYDNLDKFGEAKQWYDGYRFGNAEVYNPFSIMNYVGKNYRPEPYWVNSGGDSIVRWLLEHIDEDNFTDILGLLSGGSIRTHLSGSVSYKDLRNSDDEDLYSLMAMSGYLKAVPAGNGLFDISLPNEEVREILDKLMRSLGPLNTKLFAEFNTAVLNGDAGKMAALLEKILVGGSYRNLRENAYEVILMTVMYALVKRYDVKTEYDAGNGRTDITLTPKNRNDPPMIFELKVSGSEEDLDKDVDGAIEQIHDKRYYLGMPGKVILVGIAFFVKTPKVRIEVIDNGDGFKYKPS